MKKCSVIIDGGVNRDLVIPFSSKLQEKFDIRFKDLTAGKVPDSFECYLRFIGVDESTISQLNRSYFEAYDHLKDGSYSSYARCNLVKVDDMQLIDFSAGISPDEAYAILCGIAVLFDRMIPTRGYRSTISFNERIDYKGVLPHQNHGVSILDAMSEAPDFIKHIFITSHKYFEQKGLPYCLWPYKLSVPTVSLLMNHQTKAFVGALDALQGVSSALGMKCYTHQEMSGDVDSNLKLKLETTKRAFKNSSHVILHINGIDEASHRGDMIQREAFIEKIESHVLSELVTYCSNNSIELEIIIDHICDCYTLQHHSGPVPWMILKRGVRK